MPRNHKIVRRVTFPMASSGGVMGGVAHQHQAKKSSDVTPNRPELIGLSTNDPLPRLFHH